MADFHVIAPLASKIIDATSAWAGVAGLISSAVIAPIAVGVTISMVWHGFAVMRGAAGPHIMDVFLKALRAFLIVVLAVAGGAYASNVIGFFQELRNSLTAMFVSGADTSYSALDTAINTALNTWDPTWNWASEHMSVIPTDFSGAIAIACWFLMASALTIFAAICAINLVIIDFALAVIFALGPIFIACFAFSATSRFTDSWLAGVLKYTFTAVVISAMVGLGIGLLQRYTASLGSNAAALDYVGNAFASIAASIILGILAGRIPTIAGDIVGGIGISAFGPSMAARPLAAAASVAGMTSSGTANAAAFLAGRAVGTVAEKPSAGVDATASLGTQAAASFKPGSSSFVNAVRGHGVNESGQTIRNGGLRNAYQLGRGSNSGTGTISSGRPTQKAHVPGQP